MKHTRMGSEAARGNRGRARRGGGLPGLPVVLALVAATATAAPQLQTLQWTSPATDTVLLLNRATPLKASASSGKPVTFRVLNGPATVVGAEVVATNVGTVWIEASQSGDETFAPVAESRLLNRSTVVSERLGEWPGEERSPAVGVVPMGDYAVLALGGVGLATVDVRDPARPGRLTTYPMANGVNALRVVGGVGYVASSSGGLEIVDLADPLRPVRLGRYTGGCMDVSVFEGRAYIAGQRFVGRSRPLVFEIVDIAAPARPVALGQALLTTNTFMGKVAVEGNRAYVAELSNDHGYVEVFDVAEPTAIRRLGGIEFPRQVRSIAMLGRLAYVAAGSLGVQIVDFQAPAAPQVVGAVSNLTFTTEVAVTEGRLYAGTAAGLAVLDLTDPIRPATLSTSTVAYGISGPVAVAGDRVFVPCTGGLEIHDIQVRTSPRLLGRCATGGDAVDVVLTGDQLGVADNLVGLSLHDISDPARPRTTGGVDALGAIRIGLAGDRLVAVGRNRFRTVDLKDRSRPVVTGECATGLSFAEAVAVSGDFAFVGGTATNGVEVFDLSDSRAPVRAGVIRTASRSFGVAVESGRLFVGGWNSEFEVFDVRDVRAPVRLGGVRFADQSNGYGLSVAVSGPIACVAAASQGLFLIDIRQPSEPRVISRAPVDGAYRVAVQGNLAFVGGGGANVNIVDVTDPARSFLAGTATSRYSSYSLAVDGNRLAIAEGAPGVSLVKWRLGLRQPDMVPGRFQITAGDPPIQLPATNPSGLPVSWTVLFGPGLLENGRVLSTNAGTIVLRAANPGDAQYLPYEGSVSIEVRKRGQILTWAWPPSDAVLRPGSLCILDAVGSSGLPMTYQLLGGPARLAGAVLTVTNWGAVRIAAIQSGDDATLAVTNERVLNLRSVRAEQLGSWPGSSGGGGGGTSTGVVAAVALTGATACLVETNFGLRLVEVADPRAPRLLGSLRVDGAKAVAAFGNRALVLVTNRLLVIDISDPGAPLLLGASQFTSPASAVATDGRLAYVATDGGLVALDPNQPAASQALWAVSSSGRYLDVMVAGNRLGFAGSGIGVSLLDITTPTARRTISTYTSAGASRVALDDEWLALLTSASAPELRILRAVMPGTPPLAGRFVPTGTATRLGWARGMAWVGRQDGRVDVVDPIGIPAGSVDTPGPVLGLTFAGSRLYVANGVSGMQIYELRTGQPQGLAFPVGAPSPADSLLLEATTTAGLPVTWSVVSGPGTIRGGRLTFTGPGTVMLRGEQPGDDRFLPIVEERALVVGTGGGAAVTRVEIVDRRLLVEMEVPGGAYLWQEAETLGTWRDLYPTNLTSGVFRFHAPEPATTEARFYRLLPAR